MAATRAMFASITPDMPGCTVAASRGGEVVFAEAVGAARLDPAVPMTTDTVVDIGSTSKQFTATAVLLLAERGEVDLDAPLSSVLDDLPSWADEPSIRQLMHHESGIPDYIGLLADQGFSLGEVTTDADALDALAEVTELEFEPGTSWAYSNSNYFLMGQVVLAVTGDDLGTFLADEVFGPLDLDMVMDPTAVIEEKAISYEGEGDRAHRGRQPVAATGRRRDPDHAHAARAMGVGVLVAGTGADDRRPTRPGPGPRRPAR